MPIYTTGHSNHSTERFFEIIEPFNITDIIDIRSVPYSGRFPHFNKNNFRKTVESRGLKYHWRGDTLGGKPSDDSGFDEISKTKSFIDAIDSLMKEFGDNNVSGTACLVCAERDPQRCHRSILIGPALRSYGETGFDLHHILPDGKLVLQSSLEAAGSSPSPDRADTLPLFVSDDLK